MCPPLQPDASQSMSRSVQSFSARAKNDCRNASLCKQRRVKPPTDTAICRSRTQQMLHCCVERLNDGKILRHFGGGPGEKQITLSSKVRILRSYPRDDVPELSTKCLAIFPRHSSPLYCDLTAIRIRGQLHSALYQRRVSLNESGDMSAHLSFSQPSAPMALSIIHVNRTQVCTDTHRSILSGCRMRSVSSLVEGHNEVQVHPHCQSPLHSHAPFILFYS